MNRYERGYVEFKLDKPEPRSEWSLSKRGLVTVQTSSGELIEILAPSAYRIVSTVAFGRFLVDSLVIDKRCWFLQPTGSEMIHLFPGALPVILKPSDEILLRLRVTDPRPQTQIRIRFDVELLDG